MPDATRRSFPSGTVRSPCNSVCRIDPRTQWCEGCQRTIDEIAAWGSMGDEARRVLVEVELPARRARLRPPAGGVMPS
jgi:predicted Fe-S protein YdhL (DUF1289 family)